MILAASHAWLFHPRSLTWLGERDYVGCRELEVVVLRD
jgi:hypothetical protein